VKDNQDARDRKLDEALEETFPASDAPANTVETGTRVGVESPLAVVTDNREASQFELVVDGQTAFLTYRRTPRSLELLHTEVPPALRGRRLSDALAQAGIDAARSERLQLVIICPSVRAYYRKHRRRDTTSKQDVS